MLYFDKKDKVFNSIIYFLLIIFCLIILLPLIHIVAGAISNYNDVYLGKVLFVPTNIDLTVFKIVLSNEYIMIGYRNTIIYTVLGTLISLFLTFTAAYPLSRKDLRYRKFFNIFFIITMFVNGGMIPTYLVVENLGLKDTIFGFILPGALSVWNMIVVRTYISSSIPYELQEAARIDGCSDFKTFYRIILPLCKPMIAIMVLFYGVSYWNSYYNSLLYLSDSNLFPLQRVLSDILIANDTSNMGGIGGGLIEQGRMIESIKYVTIIISSAPMLLLYPFIQKYFSKGIITGSIKG